MGTEFVKVVEQLRDWLQSRGLPTEDVTIEVVLPTEEDARIAERGLKAEIDPRYRFASGEPLPLGVAATAHGISVRFRA